MELERQQGRGEGCMILGRSDGEEERGGVKEEIGGVKERVEGWRRVKKGE